MLTQLFNDLLLFFELAPGGTRAQFISAVVARDHATAAEAGRFADAFVESLVSLTMLDTGADFDAMMARRRQLPMEQVARAARSAFVELRQSASYSAAEAQVRVDWAEARLAELYQQSVNAGAGEATILETFPPSQVRDDTLEVIERGRQSLAAEVEGLKRYRKEHADALARANG